MSNIEIGARHVGQYPQEEQGQQGPQKARQRVRTIKFMKYVLMDLMTLEEAARALQVNSTTMDRWKRDLLSDGQQDTDDLRKLSQARKFWKHDT